jgi:hypothetical protein
MRQKAQGNRIELSLSSQDRVGVVREADEGGGDVALRVSQVWYFTPV